MSTTTRLTVALVLAASLGGCLGTGTFHGSGRRYPTGPTASVPRPAAPAPSDGRGDIRVPSARPTVPTLASSNVAITIEKLGVDERTAMAANAAFRFADERFAVRGGHGAARRNGLRIGIAGKDFRVRLNASQRRARTSTTERLFITVLSGHEGQIFVGQDTFVESLVIRTPFGDQVLAERQFVGRSLVVRPRILSGGQVEVELWPRFTVRGRRGAIDVTQLATKVVVASGQSIVIGGMQTGRDDVGSVLFGIGRRQHTSTMTMVLTPQIGGVPFGLPAPR